MKTQITTSLNHFDQNKLVESSKNLLKALGYQSERTFEDLHLTPENKAEKFGAGVELCPEKAFTDDWQQVEFLFQHRGTRDQIN